MSLVEKQNIVTAEKKLLFHLGPPGESTYIWKNIKETKPRVEAQTEQKTKFVFKKEINRWEEII